MDVKEPMYIIYWLMLLVTTTYIISALIEASNRKKQGMLVFKQ